jgi:hypothetical protein
MVDAATGVKASLLARRLFALADNDAAHRIQPAPVVMSASGLRTVAARASRRYKKAAFVEAARAWFPPKARQ